MLPFVNSSGDPTQDYFSDGLTEAILDALARERDLRVPGRSSSFSFKGRNVPAPEVGKGLNVAQLVEGSVSKLGNRVRIIVSLTRASDGISEPLGTFTEELNDVWTLQDMVAQAIVARLTKRTATPVAVLTKNPAAYDAYLRARALHTRQVAGELGELVRLYEEAARLDPGFALPWARLSQLWEGLIVGGFDRSEDNAAKARSAAAVALRLGPGLAEPHLAMAMVRLSADRDVEASQRELDEAERLRPNDPEVVWSRVRLEYARGHWNDGLASLIVRAAELDPQNGASMVTMGLLLNRIGRFAEAERLLARSTTLVAGTMQPARQRALNYVAWTGDPGGGIEMLETAGRNMGDDPRPTATLAAWRAQRGDIGGAVAAYQEVRSRTAPREAQTSGPRASHLQATLSLAQLEARSGNRPRATELYAEALPAARQFAKDFPNFPGAQTQLALAHAGRGEKREALAAVEEAMRLAAREQVVLGVANARRGKAEVLATVGEIDAAIVELRAVHDMGWGFGYTLRLDLEWEPLRGDAMFQQLMKEAEARADAQPRPKK